MLYMSAKLLQSCPTLCHSMDCSPLSSSVHGIVQARLFKWVATSEHLPDPGIEPASHFSYIDMWVLYH